jgi:hypothetical protein
VRKRDEVLNPRFHRTGRDSPDAIFEIEMTPTCFPQFARPDKEQRRELHTDSGNGPTSVAVDRAQQLTKAPRVSDTGSATNNRRFQHPPQILGHVASDVSQGDSMSEHAATPLLGPPGCMTQATDLDGLQDQQQISTRNFQYGFRTEIGKDVSFQQPSALGSTPRANIPRASAWSSRASDRLTLG